MKRCQCICRGGKEYVFFVFKIYNRLKEIPSSRVGSNLIFRNLKYETRWILERNIDMEDDVGIEDNSWYVDVKKCCEDEKKITIKLEKNKKYKQYNVCLDENKGQDDNESLIIGKKSEDIDQLLKKTKSALIQKNFSIYIDPLYQLRIALNEDMPSILCGKGKVKSLGNRLKYLEFLRKGLGPYESFLIEKKSRFYLTYTILEGMIVTELLEKKDVNQLFAYCKTGVDIIQKSLKQIFQEKSIEQILEEISEDGSWKSGSAEKEIDMPSKKNQLILILIYLISAIRSVDISIAVAQCVFEEIGMLSKLKEEHMEQALTEIDNMLLGWVKIFNMNYDFWLEVMVYIYSNKESDDRLKYLKESINGTECLDGFLLYNKSKIDELDLIMQKVYKEGVDGVKERFTIDEEKILKIFSCDSECTEQKIYRIINDFIIHECYSIEFGEIM